MKKLLYFLLFTLSFTECKRINIPEFELPESTHCDSLQNYNFIDIKITKNLTIINDSIISDLSSIRYIVAEAREGGEPYRLTGRLIADKNCPFIKIDSVLTEFRKTSLLRFYIKTNNISDSCWTAFRLLPTDSFVDSISQNILNKSDYEKDSLNIKIAEYYSSDSVKLNSKIISNENLRVTLENVIEMSNNHIYYVKPNQTNSFNDIFQLIDIYLSTLERLKANYIRKKFDKDFTELNELEFEDVLSRYPRRLAIIYLTCCTNIE